MRPAVPQWWMEYSKCRGENPDNYDVVSLPAKTDPERHRVLQKLCGGCEVMGHCADFGYKNHVSGFVFAGVAVPERHQGAPDHDMARAELRSIAETRTPHERKRFRR